MTPNMATAARCKGRRQMSTTTRGVWDATTVTHPCDNDQALDAEGVEDD